MDSYAPHCVPRPTGSTPGFHHPSCLITLTLHRASEKCANPIVRLAGSEGEAFIKTQPCLQMLYSFFFFSSPLPQSVINKSAEVCWSVPLGRVYYAVYMVDANLQLLA